MDEKRGVRIIGIFFLLCIVPSCFVIIIFGGYRFGLFGILFGILSSFLLYIAGRGLLLFKNWARIFIMVSSPLLSISLFFVLWFIFSLVFRVYTMPGFFIVMFLTALSAIIFFLFILYYLTCPKIKELFE
jgi:hypothetical protein